MVIVSIVVTHHIKIKSLIAVQNMGLTVEKEEMLWHQREEKIYKNAAVSGKKNAAMSGRERETWKLR